MKEPTFVYAGNRLRLDGRRGRTIFTYLRLATADLVDRALVERDDQELAARLGLTVSDYAEVRPGGITITATAAN